MRLSGALNQQPAPFRVRFANLDNEVEAVAGETLLASARRAGVSLGSACGGLGVCANCVVRLLSGQVDPSPEQGNNADGPRTVGEWLRACLVRPLSDCVVDVAPRALASVVRNEVGSLAIPAAMPFAPVVSTVEVTIPMHGSEVGGGDLERLLAALEGETVERVDLEQGPHVEVRGAPQLPADLRAAGNRLAVQLEDLVELGRRRPRREACPLICLGLRKSFIASSSWAASAARVWRQSPGLSIRQPGEPRNCWRVQVPRDP